MTSFPGQGKPESPAIFQVSEEFGRKIYPLEFKKSRKYKIDGCDLEVRFKEGNSIKLRLQIDDSKQPKRFDLVGTAESGERRKGIFAVDGDTLTVAIQLKPGRERPSNFASKTGNGVAVFILRKQTK